MGGQFCQFPEEYNLLDLKTEDLNCAALGEKYLDPADISENQIDYSLSLNQQILILTINSFTFLISNRVTNVFFFKWYIYTSSIFEVYQMKSLPEQSAPIKLWLLSFKQVLIVVFEHRNCGTNLKKNVSIFILKECWYVLILLKTYPVMHIGNFEVDLGVVPLCRFPVSLSSDLRLVQKEKHKEGDISSFRFW